MENQIDNTFFSEKLTNEPKALLSIRDFTYLTGISNAGFYEMLARGDAPRTIKIGGRTRIARADFNKWLADIETTSEEFHTNMMKR